jgi:hypothetical protein
MTTYALIVDGAIAEIVVDCTPGGGEPPTPDYVDVTGQPGIIRPGATWDGAAWVAPAPPPAPVPAEVTRRQLLLALRATGMLSGEEAVAAAKTGDLPAPLAAVVATLPTEVAQGVEITWAAMTTAERISPLWDTLEGAGLATSDQVDDLFRLAASL